MAIKNIIKKVKNKVLDKTSDIVADTVFGGAKAKREMKKIDDYIRDKKLVRETKGLEPYPNNDYSNPVFRARANVSNFETEYAQKMNKKYPKRF